MLRLGRAEDSGIVKAAAMHMPFFGRRAVAPGSPKNPSVDAQILIHNAGFLFREFLKDLPVVSVEKIKCARPLQSLVRPISVVLIRYNPLRGEGFRRAILTGVGFRVHSPRSFFSATAA